MEELRSKITHFLRSRVNDEDLIKDLVQDTVLKVLTKGNNMDIRNLEAWAVQIAKNALIDHYRRANKNLPENFNSIGEYNYLTDEILTCQKQFIDELDPESRYLINEIDIKGKSQKDVAGIMGIAYPSLRSKIQRARKRIKQRFEETCEFEYDAAGSIVCCWEKACP